MKISTNLSNSEMAAMGESLIKLAAPTHDEIVLENEVEVGLLEKAETAFSTMMKNLCTEISILLH